MLSPAAVNTGQVLHSAITVASEDNLKHTSTQKTGTFNKFCHVSCQK